MRIRNKFNTMFYKLTISFAVIIITVTILLSFSSFYYFSANFNSKVEQVNHKMLDHLGKIISDQIMRPVEKAYTDIFINSYSSSEFIHFINNDPQSSSTMILTAYKKLENIARSNPDLINSIYIYYRTSNAILSYPEGIKFLDGNKSILSIDPDKLIQFDNSNIPRQWLQTWNQNAFYNRVPFFSVLYSYPPVLNSSGSKCSILFNLNEEAFYHIIQQTYKDEYGHILILDEKGNVLSHSNRALLDQYLSKEAAPGFELPSDKATGNFIRSIDGVKTMVTYITIPENGWRLVNLTPVNQFYKESAVIRKTLAIICLTTIFIGLVIANIFSIRIYNPVKILMNNLRMFFDGTSDAGAKTQNEYTLINEYINNLSVKVLDLENTLTSYKPLIKHNLIFDIVNGNISGGQELASRLALIGYGTCRELFVPMVIEIGHEAMDSLNPENSQFVSYNIISHMEGVNDGDIFCVAASLSRYKTFVLFNTSKNDDKVIEKIAADVIRYLANTFTLPSIVSIGPFVKEPSELASLFKETETGLEYSFLLPGASIIRQHKVMLREMSASRFPEQLAEEFSQYLKFNEIPAIEKNLDQLTGYMLQGDYSLHQCREVLREYVSAIARHMKGIGYPEASTEELFSAYSRIRHVSGFKSWIMKLIDECTHFIETTNSQRLIKAIEVGKAYIDSHLELPISLEIVSEKVMVSPSYFSKAFKEIVGVNFVDYVNTKRMELSKQLLLSTSLSIEEVAYKVGFSNCNYFIRKFRAEYGTTPKFFKTNAKAAETYLSELT